MKHEVEEQSRGYINNSKLRPLKEVNIQVNNNIRFLRSSKVTNSH